MVRLALGHIRRVLEVEAKKRRGVGGRLLLALGVVLLAAYAYAWLTYPTDRTPLGAYLRVVKAVNVGRPQEFFAYLETPAQHACFTVGDYRAKSKALVLEAYPKEAQPAALRALEPIASEPDGPDVFAHYAGREGWLADLRRDLSGADHVEVEGERATLETARGTRYAFRRRENGIWGLTQYTAFLVQEAERAARDHQVIEQAAADYQRARP